jgi:hypothetical protein
MDEFFRKAKSRSILRRSGLDFISTCFFALAFWLSFSSVSAQYSPGPQMKCDSTEIQEKIHQLKATGMKFRLFYPKIDRSKAPFCRWESAIERNTSIPFRFRLGSLDYVNRLEQKISQ